MTESP